jgi:hypothetical protein
MREKNPSLAGVKTVEKKRKENEQIFKEFAKGTV